jgi:hypothetical protein
MAPNDKLNCSMADTIAPPQTFPASRRRLPDAPDIYRPGEFKAWHNKDSKLSGSAREPPMDLMRSRVHPRNKAGQFSRRRDAPALVGRMSLVLCEILDDGQQRAARSFDVGRFHAAYGDAIDFFS